MGPQQQHEAQYHHQQPHDVLRCRICFPALRLSLRGCKPQRTNAVGRHSVLRNGFGSWLKSLAKRPRIGKSVTSRDALAPTRESMKLNRKRHEIGSRSVPCRTLILVPRSESAGKSAAAGRLFRHDLRPVLGENPSKRQGAVSVLAERLLRTQEQLSCPRSRWLYRKDESFVGLLLKAAQRQHPLGRGKGFHPLDVEFSDERDFTAYPTACPARGYRRSGSRSAARQARRRAHR